MAIKLADLPSDWQPELTIQIVENLPTRSEWTRNFIRGYGLPESMISVFLELIKNMGMNLPLRYYLEQINRVPVATSTLILGAGVAGFLMWPLLWKQAARDLELP